METEQPITPMMAIRTLINSLPEGRERGYAVEACVALCYRLWGWNVERFQLELAKVVTGSVVKRDLSDRSSDTKIQGSGAGPLT